MKERQRESVCVCMSGGKANLEVQAAVRAHAAVLQGLDDGRVSVFEAGVLAYHGNPHDHLRLVRSARPRRMAQGR